jgi:hypothetical protein
MIRAKRPTGDPRERLYQARLAAAEGRHEEALREYVWFHNNALKQRPSLYGVRLSFALWDWTELAKVYPKARRALDSIRRKKTALLRNGKGTFKLFHDVVAINEFLKKEADTHRLFRKLHFTRPAMAARCARLALPALARARDFKLARRYLGDAEGRLAQHAELVNKGIARLPRRMRKIDPPTRDAYIANYRDEAALLVKILSGAGQRKSAMRLRKCAISLIRSASVRKRVAAGLAR